MEHIFGVVQDAWDALDEDGSGELSEQEFNEAAKRCQKNGQEENRRA